MRIEMQIVTTFIRCPLMHACILPFRR